MKTRQLLPLTPKEGFTVLLKCKNNINTASKTQSITLYGVSLYTSSISSDKNTSI